MRRFAGATLAAAFTAAALTPLTLAAGARGASADQPGTLARAGSPAGAATPSPTPSAKPSRSAEPTGPAVPPPTQQAPPPGPPAPVRGMPKPSANCLSQRGRTHLTGEPWAQRALDFSSVWDLTRGQHVTVAVVDSGIDYTPQLAGRVSRTDLTGGNGEDCVPHGTEVASIIAASDARAKGIPFYGVAPAARILAIRVQQQQATGSLTSAARRRVLLNIANGIRYAAVKHAKVINVSIQVSASYPALRSAVEFALHHNVVVVAAAGNDNPGGGQGPFYPASYPGVLSVNAAGQSGQLGNFDVRRTPVSVTAPGVGVASDYPGGFDPANNGTSFAAAFVSGEAALVRAAYPGLSAAQVVHRIVATAAGGTGAHTGAGMINPVQAVTEVLPPLAAAAASPAGRVPVPRPRAASSATRTVAFSVTAGALAAAALVAIGAVVVPQGRRRRWRPGRLGAAVPAATPAALPEAAAAGARPATETGRTAGTGQRAAATPSATHSEPRTSPVTTSVNAGDRSAYNRPDPQHNVQTIPPQPPRASQLPAPGQAPGARQPGVPGQRTAPGQPRGARHRRRR